MLSYTASDDVRLEQAILDLLAAQREIYLSPMIQELRRRHPGLRVERTRAVLERLFSERRIAQLWHRYLLARDVEVVRATWLERIDRQAAGIDADPAAPQASRDAREFLMRWDGWCVNGRDLPT